MLARFELEGFRLNPATDGLLVCSIHPQANEGPTVIGSISSYHAAPRSSLKRSLSLGVLCFDFTLILFGLSGGM